MLPKSIRLISIYLLNIYTATYNVNRVCPWDNILNIKYLYFNCTMKKKKMVETLKYCVKTVEYNSIFIAISYLNSSGTRNWLLRKKTFLSWKGYIHFFLYIHSHIVVRLIQMFQFNRATYNDCTCLVSLCLLQKQNDIFLTHIPNYIPLHLVKRVEKFAAFKATSSIDHRVLSIESKNAVIKSCSSGARSESRLACRWSWTLSSLFWYWPGGRSWRATPSPSFGELVHPSEKWV